jgi:predicted DNA-binding ribbon-helix-helix protein
MTESKLDGRSSVEVELDREEWYQLMMLAHERDITLNQLVEKILRDFIREHHNGTFSETTV